MVAGHRDLLRGRADPAGKSPAGGGTRQPDCSSAEEAYVSSATLGKSEKVFMFERAACTDLCRSLLCVKCPVDVPMKFESLCEVKLCLVSLGCQKVFCGKG